MEEMVCLSKDGRLWDDGDVLYLAFEAYMFAFEMLFLRRSMEEEQNHLLQR